MYRLALIPGIIVTILGVLALLGGAGGASLIFIIPGVFLIIIAEKKKKKARATLLQNNKNALSESKFIDSNNVVDKAVRPANLEKSTPIEDELTTSESRTTRPLNNEVSLSEPKSIDNYIAVRQTTQSTISEKSSLLEDASSMSESENDVDEYIKKLTESTRKKLIQSVPAESSYIDSLKDEFFAVDVETTGLSPKRNRIIEIAAVKFENGVPVDSYSTLVASVKHIPEDASRVNGITDEDLEFYGEDEISAYNQFTDFLGQDTLAGNICMVAHNASFDMAFIINSLKRLKYNEDVTLRYFDTLALSRKYLTLPNYKQPTVAEYYGIVNDDEHRAEGDAITCGKILVQLLENMKDEAERARIAREKSLPTDEEREICAYIKKVLMDAGKDTARLRFEKKSGGNIKAKYPYGFTSFKILKNKPMYFTFDKSDYVHCELETKDTDYRDGEAYSVRVNLEHPKQIELLEGSIVKAYKRDGKSITDFYRHTRWVQQDAEYTFQIIDNEVDSLVATCINRADKKAEQKAAHEAEKAAIEKEKEERRLARKLRAEKAEKCPKATTKSTGRKIGRYDDNMILLQEYESVSSASVAVGISPKSIRDAASGRQKHAAGYVWRYLDSNQNEGDSI